MGLGSSTEFAISPYLEALASPTRITDSITQKDSNSSVGNSQSDFWNNLLNYNYSLAALQTYQIEYAISRICDKIGKLPFL